MELSGDEIAVCKAKVSIIQLKIRTAHENNNSKLVAKLQRDLVLSREARIIAVLRVPLKRGGGSNTPGVDNALWKCREDAENAVTKLYDDISTNGYKASPVRRRFIPKAGKAELRPLGIPTLYDRSMQALWVQALSPIAELTADENSYGCREGLSTHHGIEKLRQILSQKWAPRWVLEADIKELFENISHEWILENIPMDKQILSQMLGAGVVHLGNTQTQESGVPQGGVISPMIANMCLDGLEKFIQDKVRISYNTTTIRYVDDFVVTGLSASKLAVAQDAINEFLLERGLSLNAEKTTITEISEGLNFLGVHIHERPNPSKVNGSRKGVLLTTPTKKGVRNIRASVNTLIQSGQNLTPFEFITKFNTIVRGWAEYHKYYNSSDTFQTLAPEFWRLVWKWVSKKYANTPSNEKIRNFTKIKGSSLLTATENGKTIRMYDISKTKLVYFKKE